MKPERKYDDLIYSHPMEWVWHWLFHLSHTYDNFDYEHLGRNTFPDGKLTDKFGHETYIEFKTSSELIHDSVVRRAKDFMLNNDCKNDFHIIDGYPSPQAFRKLTSNPGKVNPGVPIVHTWSVLTTQQKKVALNKYNIFGLTLTMDTYDWAAVRPDQETVIQCMDPRDVALMLELTARYHARMKDTSPLYLDLGL